MYPEQLLIPMRQELTRLGVEELKTVAEVDAKFAEHKGTALVVVNSV
ncbi:MAG: BrxA/BrxB family bacilliredoxin, partial [Gemmatimonas sp.]